MSYWVVDANIAVNTITRMTDSLSQFWDRVDREQVTPCAPRLWVSETATAIRQRVTLKEMSSEDAEDALRNIHALRFEILNEDEELSLRALEWSGKLGQPKAYDAFCLALAEKLVVDFWPADERLANRCRKDLKLNWVHSINEL